MPPGADAAQGDSKTVPGSELGFRERMLAAAGASVVSALVVNPLDVVKTRMQAQAAASGNSACAAAATYQQHNVLLEKFAFTTCPETCPRALSSALPHAASAGPNPLLSQSTLASMRHIARTEGFAQLWRGTDMALLMAVPMVGIYMPLYDYAKGALQPELGSSLAPLTAGALSRTAAVLCTAPLDLLRTRMQAMLQHTHLQPAVAGGAPAAASRTSQWMEIIRHVQASSSGSGARARVGALWTGVGATLARDVPFSAVYWALLEPVRTFLLPPSPQQHSALQPGPTFRAHPPHSASSQSSFAGHPASSLVAEFSHERPEATQQQPAAASSCAEAGPHERSGHPDAHWAMLHRDAGSEQAHPAGGASPSGRSHPQLLNPGSSSRPEGHDTAARHSQLAEARDGQAQQQRRLEQDHLRAEEASGVQNMRAAGLKDRGQCSQVHAANEDGVPTIRLLLANLVAGAVGGSAAAAMTQPLDVVKTRAQLGHHGKSTSVLQALKELAQEGGLKALFTGVTPRALKAAPACAIVLASYEALKALHTE